MRRRVLAITLLAGAAAFARGPEPMPLPKPVKQGGKPLMQALNERRSGREFAARPIPIEVLSNLLWAAYGVNRPDGRRTAASAMNRQAVDVYAVMAEGAYLYAAKGHRLERVSSADLRAATGTQAFVGTAPVNLVYVADYERFGGGPDAEKTLYAGAEAGFIGQNVYLFCASEGLTAVIRASIDREPLAKALGLRPGQRILLAQTVGYPLR